MVHKRKRRRGLSLLELVIATSMLTMVLTAVTVVLRTGRLSWEAHEADFTRIEAAHATVRHIVREVRQADAIAFVSAAGDNSGRLSLLMPSGDIKVWDHDDTTNVVNYGITNPTELLSPTIESLRFVGLRADGTTPTTVAEDVQALQIEVTVLLPVDVSGSRTVRSWAWLRSW